MATEKFKLLKDVFKTVKAIRTFCESKNLQVSEGINSPFPEGFVGNGTVLRYQIMSNEETALILCFFEGVKEDGTKAIGSILVGAQDAPPVGSLLKFKAETHKESGTRRNSIISWKAKKKVVVTAESEEEEEETEE